MFELYRIKSEYMRTPKRGEDSLVASFHQDRREIPFNDEDLAGWAKKMVNTYPSFYTIAAHVDCELDELFRLTNSIESPWSINTEVSLVDEDAFLSSTSVGDIFKDLDSNVVYLVANFGFIKIEGLNLPS